MTFINNKNEIINLTENRTVFRLLSRPDIKAEKLFKANNKEKPFYNRAITEIKYRGYIEKQIREIEKTKKQNIFPFYNDFYYQFLLYKYLLYVYV